MEKKDSSSCSCFLVAGILVFMLYQVLKIGSDFQSPRIVMEDIITWLKTLGVCLGAALLGFLLLFLYALISEKKYELNDRIRTAGKDYPVRCYPIELGEPTDGSNPARLPESPRVEAVQPVYLLITKTNHGFRLAALPEQYTWNFIPEDNPRRFHRLSGDLPGPIILEVRDFTLFYILFRQEGNGTIELIPTGQAGFTGSLPALQGADQVKIVIIYTGFMETDRRHIPRDRPLKLKLVAVNKNGRDDLKATTELYNQMFQFINSYDLSDDDDSWMYRSRPIYW